MSGLITLFLLLWLVAAINKTKKKQLRQQPGRPGAGRHHPVPSVQTGNSGSHWQQISAAKAIEEEEDSVRKGVLMNRAKAQAERQNQQRLREQERSRRSALKNTNIQDSSHDWLSRQIEEERVAYRRISAMLGLKLQHAVNCDSAINEYQHEHHCAADALKKSTKAASLRE